MVIRDHMRIWAKSVSAHPQLGHSGTTEVEKPRASGPLPFHQELWGARRLGAPEP